MNASPACTVVLISPYELGRQPFALAQPARWLGDDGFTVHCLDLSLQKLEASTLHEARLIALHLGMHTATRIAVAALPKIRELAPKATICAYGWYAPLNPELLQEHGVTHLFGGESEPDLLALAQQVREGAVQPQAEPLVRHSGIAFQTPDRSGLPELKRYAHLKLGNGEQKMLGFAETTRGCKHLCRHCPVVPVYQGRFRAIPREVVLADIRQQVAEGAEHISFGDPDFLNGPGHAMKIVQAMHDAFPQLTYDATIKVEHLLKHADLLPTLSDTGCLFVTSAVESIDPDILDKLDKGHTREDFRTAQGLLQAAGIFLSPTFVPFTPWTTLNDYLQLLAEIVDLGLVHQVAPIQLSIRLLIPKGSHMLHIEGFDDLIEDFDPGILGYPWVHRDTAVDQLQRAIQDHIIAAEARGDHRADIFAAIWALAHEHAGREVPPIALPEPPQPIPSISEPWYCCAEPTGEQLEQF